MPDVQKNKDGGKESIASFGNQTAPKIARPQKLFNLVALFRHVTHPLI